MLKYILCESNQIFNHFLHAEPADYHKKHPCFFQISLHLSGGHFWNHLGKPLSMGQLSFKALAYSIYFLYILRR